ncbi:chemotaxis response regulator protein-glutamate methylesterase [Halobacillus sp. A5]|uniref:protein-glutamate methylesterase/protein-glutamine glutaminase n=1 Tax=Halobacillus sp. A5 TaxID=2880263 RepID=UPI0020A69D65|nr:chemotaxis response regulator protein-glutamate methylesterase [Halobacillus sp. A5]MCP3026102.1 chemotaxis response regulator protein-glutamate methylesterase [Halobacillus sp. A5]
MEKVKVLVVDDSAFMRKMLTDILNKDPRIHVMATGRNGEEALEKAIQLQPDVITLDVEMPKMDGLTALKKLMKSHPTAVVMVSSLTGEGADSTIAAMTLGAVDFILKPSGSISLDIHKVEQSIIRKVITASKANVAPLIDSVERPVPASISKNIQTSNSTTKILAIGTSTGGPRALQTVLTALPEHLDCPIVIVQHMPKGFTKSLADRLNHLSKIHVTEAKEGMILKKGTAYIAPGDYHMGIKAVNGKFIIQLQQSEPQNGHRPAVNYLFRSLSLLHLHTVAIVMTGMGADGTEGLFELKQHRPDTYVIAESEKTSIVYGMPKAVIKSNLANEVVPVDKISERIKKVI